MTNKKIADPKASQNDTDGNYTTQRRAAKVIERTADGHAVMVACPYCNQPHIHAAPTAADPLRLRKAVCDQAMTYILGEVAK
jgi:hypothetical protein